MPRARATTTGRVPPAGRAVVVVVALVLVALASGGAGAPGGPDGRVTAGAADTLSVVGVALFACVLLSGAVLFVVLLAGPARPGGDDRASTVVGRGRARLVAVGLVGFGASIAYLLGAGLGQDALGPPDRSSFEPYGAGVEPHEALSSTQRVASTAVGVVVALAALVMIGGAAVVAVRRLTQRRGEVAAGRPEPEPDPTPGWVGPDAGPDDLTAGDPAAAVVRAWERAEACLAGRGLGRRRGETAAEHAERVVLLLPPAAGAAVADLAALLQEARFSTHPTGESARQRAIADLGRLEGALADDPVGVA